MAAAVGTVTTLTEEIFDGVKTIYWAWKGGTTEVAIASATTTAYYTGKLIYAVIDPGANVKVDYNVTVLDKNDNDVLARAGLALGASTTVNLLTGDLGAVAHSQLELVVQDAGSAATEVGEIWLWIR